MVDGLPFRCWSAARSTELAAEEGASSLLTIATFNVLAEAFEFGGWHGAWRNRRERLIDVSLQADPDILCLQEVDHFDDFFEPELRRRGYTGYFAPKTKNPKREDLPTEGQ